jgi:hypothetical protein
MVMTEPEYIYVKGSGWVPFFESALIGTSRDGKQYHITERTPKTGEKYMRITTNGAWYKNGKLDPNRPLNHLKSCTMRDLYSWGLSDRPQLNFTYLVVVPL